MGNCFGRKSTKKPVLPELTNEQVIKILVEFGLQEAESVEYEYRYTEPNNANVDNEPNQDDGTGSVVVHSSQNSQQDTEWCAYDDATNQILAPPNHHQLFSNEINL